MTQEQVVEMLRAACAKADRFTGWGGQAAWAKQHRIQKPIVSDVLHGTRPPSDAILHALGLRKIVSYEPAGMPGRASPSIPLPLTEPADTLGVAGSLFAEV